MQQTVSAIPPEAVRSRDATTLAGSASERESWFDGVSRLRFQLMSLAKRLSFVDMGFHGTVIAVCRTSAKPLNFVYPVELKNTA